MGRLTEALGQRNRRTSVNNANRNSVNADIAKAVNELNKMLDYYNTAISKKTLLKKAGNIALKGLKQKATDIEDTGNLKNSAKWINTKSNRSVMAGFDYWNGGRHAHLVEYGFVTKNGDYVPGYNLVKKVYEATKDKILQNLIDVMRQTQATIERQIAR